MIKIRSNQLAAAVVATGFLALSLGARAESGAQSMDAAACKSAQMSAWFERQRQLTDGDTNPFQAMPNARECATSYSANGADDAERREKVAAAATTRKQELRWDFPGSQSGQ